MKRKAISEIERAIQDVDRPMRWPTAEQIAQRFLKAVLLEWERFEKDLIKILREISDQTDVAEGKVPTYQTLLRRERNSAKEAKKKASCSCGEDHTQGKAEKDLKPSEVSELLLRLRQWLPSDMVQNLSQLFQQYLPNFIGVDPLGIFDTYLPEVWADGYEQAYTRMKRAAQGQGANQRFQQVPQVFPFNRQARTVEAYYEEVYRLVTNKITVAAAGEVFSVMVQGLTDGLSWSEMAYQIHMKAGAGYRYHWKRLVRTEMTKVYDRSMTQRFQNGGVSYVKLSLSIGACPICVGLEGYYTLGLQPRLPDETHPNCRCVWIPFYRLPDGVNLVR